MTLVNCENSAGFACERAAMSRTNLLWLLLVPALIIFGVGVTATAPAPSKDYQLVRSIVDVLAAVDKAYVRELSDEEKKRLVEAMINGGLEKLDPHSQYFNEEEAALFETQTEGQFGGVGILVGKDPGVPFIKVESPIPGTPAYHAGVQAGDLILKVDGKSTENVRSDEVRKMILGKEGTVVKLSLLGEGDKEPREVSLKRALIELHPIQGSRRDPANPENWIYLIDDSSNIAHIRLNTFSEKTAKELKDAIEQASKAGAKALILDMRDNPGGLLTQASAVADVFLEEGKIVSTKGRAGIGTEKFAKKDGGPFESKDKPMVVLVNRASASASEIVAAALQDHKRAIVIGERSYGKGSVQNVMQLSGQNAGPALKLTTQVWLTANGRNIHRWPDSKETDDWGVRPDAGFEIKLTDEQRREYFRFVRDLDMVKGKPGTVKDKKAEESKPFRDPMVEKAAEYLKSQLK
jgi:carboxyl-terminal processing protease